MVIPCFHKYIVKPFRNIYIMMNQDEFKFTGTLEIPYEGQVYYGVQVEDLPREFDEEKDVYYTCPCDLEEFKLFKKIQ